VAVAVVGARDECDALRARRARERAPGRDMLRRGEVARGADDDGGHGRVGACAHEPERDQRPQSSGIVDAA
jgi:hypothetical protein